MLEQASLPFEKASLPWHDERDQAALSLDVASRRNTRLLWTGLGFAVIILIGFSANALHPLSLHASAESPRLVAFVGLAPARLSPLGGIRSSRHARPARTVSSRAAATPGSRPETFPETLQQKRQPTELPPAGSEIQINSRASVDSESVVAAFIPKDDPAFSVDHPMKTGAGVDTDLADLLWEKNFEDEKFWDVGANQWKTMDANGQWRDQGGRVSTAPNDESMTPWREWRDQGDDQQSPTVTADSAAITVPELPISEPVSYGAVAPKPAPKHAGDDKAWGLAESSLVKAQEYMTIVNDGVKMRGPSRAGDLMGPVTFYNRNVAEAAESLKRDMPQALMFERDAKRLTPTNWDIFDESLESDFNKISKTPTRLLATLIPSWNKNIVGLKRNQRVLQELRTLVAALRSTGILLSNDMSVDIKKGMDRLDIEVFEDVLEARWTAKLVIRRLWVPRWLPSLPFESILGSSRTEPGTSESLVRVSATSRFNMNPEGKIYRTSIDQLSFDVDGKDLVGDDFRRILAIAAALPTPRLPLPRDIFRGPLNLP